MKNRKCKKKEVGWGVGIQICQIFTKNKPLQIPITHKKYRMKPNLFLLIFKYGL
jgi:hypothetical protein